MQLIFFLLWIIGLGIWLTVVYFVRTQLRTIDAIRPRVNLVFIALIASSLIFFGIALMNIINYRADTPATTQLNTTNTSTVPTSTLRSTTNEKVY